MLSRDAVRLAQLPHATLATLLSDAMKQGPAETYHACEAALSAHAPLPQWATEVMLDPDLLGLMFSHVLLTSSVPLVCKAWSSAWNSSARLAAALDGGGGRLLTQGKALATLRALTKKGDRRYDYRRTFTRLGVVPRLVNIMSTAATVPNTAAIAAQALWLLARVEENRLMIAQESVTVLSASLNYIAFGWRAQQHREDILRAASVLLVNFSDSPSACNVLINHPGLISNLTNLIERYNFSTKRSVSYLSTIALINIARHSKVALEDRHLNLLLPALQTEASPERLLSKLQVPERQYLCTAVYALLRLAKSPFACSAQWKRVGAIEPLIWLSEYGRQDETTTYQADARAALANLNIRLTRHTCVSWPPNMT